MRLGWVISACGILIAMSIGRAAQGEDLPDVAKVMVPFVQKHCVHCHGEKKPKGDLSLHAFKDEASILKARKIWIRVLEQLRSGEMPPKERPRPALDEKSAFAKSVRAVFDKADSGKPDPGRVPIRRLNRTEYTNTVRELLKIDLTIKPAATFPTDPVTYGFDNIADALSISPVLMEKYFTSAEMIAERAIRAEIPKRTVVGVENTNVYRPTLRTDKVSVASVVQRLETLARNDPNEAKVRFNLARAHAAAYALKSETVKVLRGDETSGVWFGSIPPHLPFQLSPTQDPAKRQAAREHLDKAVAVYREVLGLAPDSHTARLGLAWCLKQSGERAAAMKEFRAAIDAAWMKEKELKVISREFRSIVSEGSYHLLPLLDATKDTPEIATLKERSQQVKRIVRDPTRGGFRLLDTSKKEPHFTGPFYHYSGDGSESISKFSAADEFLYRAVVYVETASREPVRVALFSADPGLPEYSTEAEKDQLFGNLSHHDVRPMKILKIAEVSARSIEDQQRIEVLVSRRGRIGPIRVLGIALVKPKSDAPPVKLHFKLEVEGPLPPISHTFLVGSLPDKPQPEQTREIIGRLLPRAFRRPVTKEEIEAIAQFADRAVQEGQKWEVGMQHALMAMLCSPKFLFRAELDDRPDSIDAHPIGDFELASRLSYFLWSSMPDEELFDLAAKGKLAANLDAQVRRMLKDRKSIALVDNFAMQWLQLSPLKTHAPDPKLFPKFGELREDMLMETKLFLHSIIREDRSLLDMISSDYTFLNGRLGGHYGILDTLGNGHGTKVENRGPGLRRQFVRVRLQGAERGGLLTQASVLTVTSPATRTSPVKRGAWVLEKILGTTTPPPPPNVPELDQQQSKTAGSRREQLEKHRANAACASCHAKIDPLGFAFENYNAIGAFRKRDGNKDIDASGMLPDGRKIEGVSGLKKVLLAQKELFVRSFTERLLTYALGRGVEYYDKRAVDRIVATAAKDDFKFSQLVVAIAQSDPFRLRRGKEPLK